MGCSFEAFIRLSRVFVSIITNSIIYFGIRSYLRRYILPSIAHCISANFCRNTLLPINNRIGSSLRRLPVRRNLHIRRRHGEGTVVIKSDFRLNRPAIKGIASLLYLRQRNRRTIRQNGIINIGTASGIIGQLISIAGIININNRLTLGRDIQLLKLLRSEAFTGLRHRSSKRANGALQRFRFGRSRITGIIYILEMMIDGIVSLRAGIGDGIHLIRREGRDIINLDFRNSLLAILDGNVKAGHRLYINRKRLTFNRRIIFIHLRLLGGATISIDKIDRDRADLNRRIDGGENSLRRNGRGDILIPADGLIAIDIRDIGRFGLGAILNNLRNDFTKRSYVIGGLRHFKRDVP